MLVSFKNDTSSDSTAVQNLIFQHLAATAGFFKAGGSEHPGFLLEFSEDKALSFDRPADNRYSYKVPLQVYTEFKNHLSCADSDHPEVEPAGISTPVLDETGLQVKREIVDFCSKNSIPFVTKAPWPAGKKLAICFTHDVDFTRKYGLTALSRDFLKGEIKALKRHFSESVFQNNVYWNFEDLLQFYRQNQFVATFFFIGRPWEGFHYRYDIRKNKYRQLFERILSDGHELGLHSSRFAFDNPGRITSEKRRLEGIIGKELTGVRQHYLRLLFPRAWQQFEEAGFRYDTSCGYNSSLGFRAGTSLPFQSYNSNSKDVYNLYEIPFSLMDYPWLENLKSGQDPLNDLSRITSPVERTNGLLNLIWHPHNIVEEGFSDLWNLLIKYVQNKDAYHDTLNNIISWWDKRASLRLLSCGIVDEVLEIGLQSDTVIENMCLEIYSPDLLQMVEGLQENGNGHYRLVVPRIEAGKQHIRLKRRSTS